MLNDFTNFRKEVQIAILEQLCDRESTTGAVARQKATAFIRDNQLTMSYSNNSKKDEKLKETQLTMSNSNNNSELSTTDNTYSQTTTLDDKYNELLTNYNTCQQQLADAVAATEQYKTEYDKLKHTYDLFMEQMKTSGAEKIRLSKRVKELEDTLATVNYEEYIKLKQTTTQPALSDADISNRLAMILSDEPTNMEPSQPAY